MLISILSISIEPVRGESGLLNTVEKIQATIGHGISDANRIITRSGLPTAQMQHAGTTMVIGKLCAHIVSSTVMPVPMGYSWVSLTNIWPAGEFNIDSSLLPTVNEIEVVHLHESLAASMKAV